MSVPRDRVLGARRDVQTPGPHSGGRQDMPCAPTSPRHEKISPEQTSQGPREDRGRPQVAAIERNVKGLRIGLLTCGNTKKPW